MEEAPPATRRALRERTGAPGQHGTPGSRLALGWVDEETIGTRRAPEDLGGATSPYLPVSADLLARRPRRSPLRPGVVVPILAVAGLTGAYAGTTLLWPLHAVAPTVTDVAIADLAAPPTTLAWPANGSAAVGVAGIPGSPASTGDALPIASITKLVTVLMVLEESPLALGEQGEEFAFTSRDRTAYWDALANDESALDVPVGGTLTRYQLLQGILIGSAGNYAERLASTYWPTDEVFARAAATWLRAHDLDAITVVEPTGISEANSAPPAALITLARLALANPVVAEIVRTPSVELPGAGLVENTNDLLADPAVVGLKTGSLSGLYNLLAAKEAAVGETAVRVYALVLGQPDDASRDGETARLLTDVAAEVSQVHTVPAGTVAGVASTAWGTRVDIVTDADVSAVLWNAATAAVTIDLRLGDARAADAGVGTLTVKGPLTTETIGVHLTAEIEPPDAWWRLSHPLELFGLID